ncbi:beta-galactosidase [Anopheles sinensis]|uniref:Beta-galactosidase n=1 Tax=Anopheles sinensis TaxID=74873 RepID=A0A084WMT2_ANOSI|nr:beta-galactosidase [Anopheles sinensis]
MSKESSHLPLSALPALNDPNLDEVPNRLVQNSSTKHEGTSETSRQIQPNGMEVDRSLRNGRTLVRQR